MRELLLTFTLVSTLLAQSPDRSQALEDLAFSVGVQAYLYGYPLVLMGATERTFLTRGVPVNHFAHLPNLSTPATRAVVYPNVDTLYSSAWLDLSQGPLWLHVPEIRGRYYTVQFMDAYTDNFAYVGTRTNGGAAMDYAIVAARSQAVVPAALTKIEAPTPVVWVLGRLLAGDTEDDLAPARALQRQFTLAPLREYGKGPAPPDGPPPNPAGSARRPPPRLVAGMNAGEFYGELARLMKTSLPRDRDAPLVRQFAVAGLAPGEAFDIEKLDPSVRRGLTRAAAAARNMIEAKIGAIGAVRNGWQFQEIGKWGDDFLRRSAYAWLGLAGNDPEEAIYIGAFTDGDGRPLDGAHEYKLHFDRGKTPPVGAFWSVTMYDRDRYLVENRLRRYAIRDRTPGLRYNADGSLDIFVAREESAGQRSNWLPAAAGEFSLQIRLYLPKPEVLSGAWQPPAVTRLR